MTKKEILEHIQLRASGIGQAKDYSYKDFFNEMVEMQREEVKNLIIPDVGSTFAVEFAQYIAEEHFRLVNVQNVTYYWKDETSLRTTEQLLEHFKNTKQ